MSRVFSSRLVKSSAYLTGLAATAYATNTYYLQSSGSVHNDNKFVPSTFQPLVTSKPAPPSRSDMINKLETTKNFDVLIIGGGAVGTGTAVDAATRGLNVALVEKTDFAAGTSSKSTKMAHGGVRYLEKAVFQLSKAQLDLVIEALNERGSIVSNAPHLASILPIMIPVYHYWQVPYFYVGTKLYDIFAGRQNLKSSYLLSKNSAKSIAPMLDDKDLVAGLVYHDGLFNDARLNATLALTAVENGATVANYVEVKQLLKSEDNKVIGAVAVDKETGKEFQIKATSVINATGPFSDKILEMDNDPKGLPPIIEQAPKMVVPSAGVHIILPEYYCPKDMGLLDASTSDGRVMFFLPWQGKVLAGTTDTPQKRITDYPVPTEEEIDDILKELQKYIKFPVRKEDVLSAWSGIRPLVRNPDTVTGENTGSTQGLVRSHLIYKSVTGLLTISGGKWTTYREMAQETMDNIVKDFDFGKEVKPCQTRDFTLVGGEHYDDTYSSRLIQAYNVEEKIASHLANNYGTRAPLILEIYKQSTENQKPVVLAGKSGTAASYEAYEFPFTVAELKYSLQYEYTRTPIDFLARRTRLAFLNAKQSLEAVDGVTEIMAKELKWSSSVKEQHRADAADYIKKMGINQTS
ncbi:glycerol-3-phosphate dehydrogenase [Saccharomycopsis crataegensis]|uniref:Glycerol-3-phosphate dehydrogenase n=1 Tax=Saccharomycopsis crataegensis TaxID=43959 RepID=A0AAV5QS06_9ASCO|nr:glycerol-3-phosphate dehydrogenase [Saccharomycopsis crataegensis]